MSLRIGDNFDYKGKSPNFDRDNFETLDEMINVPDEYIDDGHISYCLENKQHYKYDSSIETTDLGKWVPLPTEQGQKCFVDEETLKIGQYGDNPDGTYLQVVRLIGQVDTELNPTSTAPVENQAVTRHINNVEIIVNGFNDRIVTIEESNRSLTNKVGTNENNINILNEKVGTNENNINILNEKVGTNENNITNLESEINRLDREKLTRVFNKLKQITVGDSGDYEVILEANDYQYEKIVFYGGNNPTWSTLYTIFNPDYINNIFNHTELFYEGIRNINISIYTGATYIEKYTGIYPLESYPNNPDITNNELEKGIDNLYSGTINNINIISNIYSGDLDGGVKLCNRFININITCIMDENNKFMFII